MKFMSPSLRPTSKDVLLNGGSYSDSPSALYSVAPNVWRGAQSLFSPFGRFSIPGGGIKTPIFPQINIPVGLSIPRIPTPIKPVTGVPPLVPSANWKAKTPFPPAIDRRDQPSNKEIIRNPDPVKPIVTRAELIKQLNAPGITFAEIQRIRALLAGMGVAGGAAVERRTVQQIADTAIGMGQSLTLGGPGGLVKPPGGFIAGPSPGPINIPKPPFFGTKNGAKPMADLGDLFGNLATTYIQAKYGQTGSYNGYRTPDYQRPAWQVPGTDIEIEGDIPFIDIGRAKKRGCRRRRKRLATLSDIKDLAALKSVLGGGKAFETWIATHS